MRLIITLLLCLSAQFAFAQQTKTCFGEGMTLTITYPTQEDICNGNCNVVLDVSTINPWFAWDMTGTWGTSNDCSTTNTTTLNYGPRTNLTVPICVPGSGCTGSTFFIPGNTYFVDLDGWSDNRSLQCSFTIPDYEDCKPEPCDATVTISSNTDCLAKACNVDNSCQRCIEVTVTPDDQVVSINTGISYYPCNGKPGYSVGYGDCDGPILVDFSQFSRIYVQTAVTLDCGKTIYANRTLYAPRGCCKDIWLPAKENTGLTPPEEALVIQLPIELQLSPNPTEGELNVSISEDFLACNTEGLELSLTDAIGREVQRVPMASCFERLSLADRVPGTYTVRLLLDGETRATRQVILK